MVVGVVLTVVLVDVVLDTVVAVVVDVLQFLLTTAQFLTPVAAPDTAKAVRDVYV